MGVKKYIKFVGIFYGWKVIKSLDLHCLHLRMQNLGTLVVAILVSQLQRGALMIPISGGGASPIPPTPSPTGNSLIHHCQCRDNSIKYFDQTEATQRCRPIDNDYKNVTTGTITNNDTQSENACQLVNVCLSEGPKF